MQMIATGISYKTAPVEMREKIAFNESEMSQALKKLYSYDSIIEVVLLSTCNRTEFYIISNDIKTSLEDLEDFITKEKGIESKHFEEFFYIYYNKFASEHLYKVASGIESVIIGEGEVLAQVKNAFQVAMQEGTTSKIFNSLFKFAIETGKKVRTDTTIAQRPISAGSLIQKIAKDTFGYLDAKSVLIVGAGKINQIVAKNLKGAGVDEGIIVNRTLEKAEILANELGWKGDKLENLDQYIADADIIVVSVGAPNYLLTDKNFINHKDKILVIDLSVPRNIYPEIKKNKKVVYYDNELIEKVIEVNKEERNKIIKEAEELINQDMSKFIHWYNAFEVSPVISSLSGFMEDIRKGELEKTFKKNNFDEAQINAIEILTKSIVQKIIHYPVTNLKMAENKEAQLRYAEGIKYLFQLESEDAYKKYVRSEVQEHPSENKLTCPFAAIQNVDLPHHLKTQISSEKNHQTLFIHQKK